MISFGLIKTSLIDYPQEVAAVLFTRGCNLRCPYCHNPELVVGPEPPDMLSFGEVMDFLTRRKHVLGGVSITGGEPLLHPEITDVIDEIKKLGLKVKIDTNGTLPAALAEIRPDYLAMDVKTLPEKYHLLGADMNMAAAVRESIDFLLKSDGDYEFRTTVAPKIVGPDDAGKLADLLGGAKLVVLTGMRPGITLDAEYGRETAPYPEGTLESMKEIFDERNIPCRIRYGRPKADGKKMISGEGT